MRHRVLRVCHGNRKSPVVDEPYLKPRVTDRPSGSKAGAPTRLSTRCHFRIRRGGCRVVLHVRLTYRSLLNIIDICWRMSFIEQQLQIEIARQTMITIIQAISIGKVDRECALRVGEVWLSLLRKGRHAYSQVSEEGSQKLKPGTFHAPSF